MKKVLTCILLLMGVTISYGQGPGSQSANRGEQLMDQMQYSAAAQAYQQAVDVAPRNAQYRYGLALAHYRQKNYRLAVQHGEEIMRLGGYEPDYYRLLGNSYDLNGNYEKAIETLRKGLKVHQYNGDLYFDMGIIAMERSKMQEAITFFEAGIKTQPPNANNYFLATKLYAKSNEPIWALIYGEIFMNMERGTERFDEISQLLYDTYAQLLENRGGVSRPEIFLQRSKHNPFYEGHKRILQSLIERNRDVYYRSAASDKGRDMVLVISNLRKNFIDNWLSEFGQTYATSLYHMHQKMKDNGYFDAYNYWMFNKPGQAYFSEWLKMGNNSQQYQQFINWYLTNPLRVGFNDYLVRTKYESQ